MSDKGTAVQTAPAARETATLKLVEPEKLIDRINRLHQEIERRAFQFFEGEGGLFGHELDHWFKAEAELLHPVHVQISETDDAVQVRAEVPGFTTKDIEVSIDKQRLTIAGKKESTEESKKGNAVYKEQCSNEILRVVDLPVEIDAAKATATLKDGVLSLSLPNAAQAREKTTKVEVKAVAS
jgi:HSP20 family protein